MRIFVTGASGFIGKQLLELLRGHDVLCLTRDAERLHALPFVTAIQGSLQEQDRWRSALKDFSADACLHLAWEGLPDYSLDCCRRNVDANLRLFDAVTSAGMKKIVVAGSCWEYGAATGAVPETQAPVECGVFAAAKNALRTILESVASEHGFAYCWGRIFFAYGPGQRAASLISHCHAAFAGGKTPEIRSPEAVQDFIYVDDVARGILALTESKLSSGIYNLGSGQPSTVGEIVNMIGAHYGFEPIHKETSRHDGFWSDTAKTRVAAGWQAETSLADGIARTLQSLDEKSVHG
jgi:nucleoside-diphosphate-sugar epimerase